MSRWMLSGVGLLVLAALAALGLRSQGLVQRGYAPASSGSSVVSSSCAAGPVTLLAADSVDIVVSISPSIKSSGSGSASVGSATVGGGVFGHTALGVLSAALSGVSVAGATVTVSGEPPLMAVANLTCSGVASATFSASEYPIFGALDIHFGPQPIVVGAGNLVPNGPAQLVILGPGGAAGGAAANGGFGDLQLGGAPAGTNANVIAVGRDPTSTSSGTWGAASGGGMEWAVKLSATDFVTKLTEVEITATF